MENEYIRTLEDEIDWKTIDQLHNSTLKFSSTSLELKKIMFVMISILVPSLLTVTKGILDLSLFISLYVLLLTFWFLDSFTYYYQEKLRALMNLKFKTLKIRNGIIEENVDDGIVLNDDRTEETRKWRSFWNSSIYIYPILIFLNVICTILYLIGVIG